ncbi:two-component system, OmpR family, sensor histidine kinase TctE [Ensifer adhaerens]|nr:two-component system, OmpR family, sensor histidine kinase TctE [Ensifer adhaerens]
MAGLSSLGSLVRPIRESLYTQLLVWVLLTLLGVLTLNIYFSMRQAVQISSIVTDNTLMGSARMIAEAVRTDEQGNVTVEIPPAALENFANGYGDRVYYSVRTAWGTMIAGYSELEAPPVSGQGRTMRFRNEEVRALAIEHPVIGLEKDGTISVTVAVTLNGETDLARRLWTSDFLNQFLLVIVAGVVTLLGLKRGLAPLMRLREAVIASRRERLEPFDPGSVQTELRPLVQALNDYMARVQRQMASQRRFVANAAHQLRTPLTLLTTQASVAARESDEERRRDALNALIRSTRQASRLAEQLLTLTRAEPGSRTPRAERIDMAEVARLVLEAQAEDALKRGIDLGLEGEGEAPVVGDGTMLREMVVNLVDNALRYTPTGGEVTVRVAHLDGDVVLTVDDNGPGIPEEEREHVFERFYRIMGTQAEGSGLGLAIVREVVEGAGGTVMLATSNAGGLSVRVRLPGAE